MTTISKNARLSITALMFGAALITGVNAFGMGKGVSIEDADRMDTLAGCFNKCNTVAQIADASGCQVDQEAYARAQKEAVAQCLNRHDETGGSASFDRYGNLHPIALEADERTALFIRTVAIHNRCDIIKESSIVSPESREKAEKISRAAAGLLDAIKDYNCTQYDTEAKQNSWFSWFTK